MAHAETLDELAALPRSRERDNVSLGSNTGLAMLHIDELGIDFAHLNMLPLEEPVGIGGGSGGAHEQSVEIEPADEQVDIALDMEGVSIDDPVRLYLREIGRVSLLT